MRAHRLVNKFIRASAEHYNVELKKIIWATGHNFANQHVYAVFEEAASGQESQGLRALKEFWAECAKDTMFSVGRVNFHTDAPDAYPNNRKYGFNFAATKVGLKGNLNPLSPMSSVPIENVINNIAKATNAGLDRFEL